MTVDERIEAIAKQLNQLTTIHLDADREYVARFEAIEKQAAAAEERHNRELAAIRGDLRRAVRLAVQEARSERRKRSEMFAALDEKITQIVAAQLVTEELLQRFLKRSGNGNPSV